MTLERYLEAATRENTQRSYASALRHFEVEWGGHLPATPDSVARYLADYAGQLTTNTLRHRLAALAGWHHEHGFVDPTRAPLVRKVLKGIQTLHPSVEKQAEPLQLIRLAQVDDWLAGAITAAQEPGSRPDELRHRRDRALVLLGFWRGVRGDELIRVRVEHLRLGGFVLQQPATGERRAGLHRRFRLLEDAGLLHGSGTTMPRRATEPPSAAGRGHAGCPRACPPPPRTGW